MRRTSLLLLLVLALAACDSDDKPAAASGPTATASSAAPTVSGTASPTPTPTEPVARTPELDAIGVIGHSGATGADSDGDGRDVPANSWVTGDNPDVDSLYLRLLADHPALKDHNWNEAISGSDVSGLMDQAEVLLTHDPVPDIVVIQSIDNDIRCDGSDEDNYDPFAATMAEVVSYLQTSVPGIRIFFDDQAVSVRAYDATILTMEGGLAHLVAPGPCNVIKHGAIDPAGEAYLQKQVDTYYGRLVDLCGQVPDCATDQGALQEMSFRPEDIASDMNHFSVSGLAKEAAIVWQQLPTAWKH